MGCAPGAPPRSAMITLYLATLAADVTARRHTQHPGYVLATMFAIVNRPLDLFGRDNLLVMILPSNATEDGSL